MIPFELAYHGRTLTPQPINAPLHELATGFERTGREVFVLEPGDGTRYVFILVKGVAVPTWRSNRPWFICPLEGLSCHRVGPHDLGFEPEHVGVWDLDFLSNEWSREFLTAWVRWFYATLQAREEVAP